VITNELFDFSKYQTDIEVLLTKNKRNLKVIHKATEELPIELIQPPKDTKILLNGKP